MVKFPLAIDMSFSNFYLTIFEQMHWMNDVRKIELDDDERNIKEILNDYEIIKKIAIEDYGIVIGKDDSSYKALGYYAKNFKEDYILSSRFGYLYKNISQKNNDNNNNEDYSILIEENKINVIDDRMFNISSRSNALYNIISIYILILAKKERIFSTFEKTNRS